MAKKQSHIRVFKTDKIIFKRKLKAWRKKNKKRLGEAQAFHILLNRKR